MTKKSIEVPSVLAFEKRLVPSDGVFFQNTWDGGNKKVLLLTRKNIRGTISNRLKAVDVNESKMQSKMESANLQAVDSCALDFEHDTLELHYTLKIIGGIAPNTCNSQDFAIALADKINNVDDSVWDILASRYAENIVNARALWRNRFGAYKAETKVTFDQNEFVFDSLNFDLNKFSGSGADFLVLKDYLKRCLTTKGSVGLVKIVIRALVGEGQEVYPSEELPLNKKAVEKENKVSKILYDLNGQAAMHSQKIGNAIRTIDTWHGVDEIIPVETYGAVTNKGMAYRSSKNDFYNLFDNWITNTDSSNDCYLIAMLVRGGVFGKKGD